MDAFEIRLSKSLPPISIFKQFMETKLHKRHCLSDRYFVMQSVGGYDSRLFTLLWNVASSESFSFKRGLTTLRLLHYYFKGLEPFSPECSLNPPPPPPPNLYLASE